MNKKKLQVFVSSTYTDLIAERQAAVEAILSAGHIPAGMELFSPGNDSQMNVIKQWIDESDVYMLILGGRYGSIDSNTGKSYTHLEYEYAASKGKPMFAVVITDEGLKNKVQSALSIDAMERENSKALGEFKKLVTSKLIKFWTDMKDIQLTIIKTLGEFSRREDLVGWIRSDQGVNAALLAEQIANLTAENSGLRKALSSQSGIEPLYAGLTYDELFNMLDSEDSPDSKLGETLFDYFMEIASNLIEGEYRADADTSLIGLRNFMLVHKNSTADGLSHYHMTEEGRKFYLRALSIRNYDGN